MQLAPASATAAIPAPRPSAGHASFDVLAYRTPDGTDHRLGLVARSRFWQVRGGESAYTDAATAAQELAAKRGEALAIVAAHPGMLFLVPVFQRAATPGATDTVLPATLDALAGATLVARHGRVLGIAGADRVVDLRGVDPALGSGRG